MDYKTPQKQEQQFQLIQNKNAYLGQIELIDQGIQIILTFGVSHLKWSGTYSIEQLQQINGIFSLFNSKERAFEYLKGIFNDNGFVMRRDGTNMILTFSMSQQNFQVEFDIQLEQEEISSIESMSALNKAQSELQIKNEQLEQNLIKTKEEYKNKIQQQADLINSQNIKIQELENQVKLVKEENVQCLQQMRDIKKNVEYLFQESKYSEILYLRDLENINNWIHEGKKSIELKLLYRATNDGFQIEKFYDRCSNVSHTLVLIKTTQNKRFGGYTDLIWKNMGGQVASNPNKTFIFSLDYNQKYTSNQSNCSNAIYGQCDRFAFGGGHDIYIPTNSNTTNSCYTNPSHTYGKSEGLQYNEYISGEKNFTAKEIEVFQVIFN